jgi:hypothetical protein
LVIMFASFVLRFYFRFRVVIHFVVGGRGEMFCLDVARSARARIRRISADLIFALSALSCEDE